MGALAIAQLVVGILTGLPSLIQAVESLFGAAKGQGTVKKDAVMAVTKAALAAAAATGNDQAAKPEVQDEILKLTGQATDAVVGTFNATRAWSTTGSDR